MNHGFHRICILIIGDGFITGSIVPVGEAVVNFIDISCLSVHNTLIAQGRITLLLAHDILTPVPVLPGGHDVVSISLSLFLGFVITLASHAHPDDAKENVTSQIILPTRKQFPDFVYLFRLLISSGIGRNGYIHPVTAVIFMLSAST